MKNSIKILLAVSAFTYGNLILGQTASQSKPAETQNASKGMTPEERADKRTEQLKGKLNLSPDQMPKVKQVLTNNEIELEKALKEADQDKSARQSAADKNRIALVHEMSKVLNSDQTAKFKDMEENKNPPAQK
jgi:hypothetical protein